MTARAHQSQSEYSAGYRSGLDGEPKPSREKGSSFYGGWLLGIADRMERAEQQMGKT